MSFKKYFEYLTSKEREKAFKAGQTNLDPAPHAEDKNIKPPEKKEIPYWFCFTATDPEMKRDLNVKTANQFFVKNKLPKNECRLVITQNGDFYTNEPEPMSSIHKGIVAYMYLADDPVKINRADLHEWHLKKPNKFLCLVYHPEKKMMTYAESYGMQAIKNLLHDEHFINKWNEILKKAGLPKIYEEYNEENND